jgi:hypothetical protein
VRPSPFQGRRVARHHVQEGLGNALRDEGGCGGCGRLRPEEKPASPASLAASPWAYRGVPPSPRPHPRPAAACGRGRPYAATCCRAAGAPAAAPSWWSCLPRRHLKCVARQKARQFERCQRRGRRWLWRIRIRVRRRGSPRRLAQPCAHSGRWGLRGALYTGTSNAILARGGLHGEPSRSARARGACLGGRSG